MYSPCARLSAHGAVIKPGHCGKVQPFDKNVNCSFGNADINRYHHRFANSLLMREAASTTVIGSRLALLPYRRRYVAQYHEWMEDEWLRGEACELYPCCSVVV